MREFRSKILSLAPSSFVRKALAAFVLSFIFVAGSAITAYANEDNLYPVNMRITVNQTAFTFNGETFYFDVAPYIDADENRSMIPMRFIADAFGADVFWDEATQTQTITLDGNTFELIRDVPLNDGMGTPRLVSDRFMVPLRYVSEELGATVEWEEETRSNVITFVSSREPVITASREPTNVAAPVFTHIFNRYAQVNSEIDFMSGVSATSELGPVEITVDSSGIDTSQPGRHRITYTATDQQGNTSTATAFLALSNANPETVLAQADGIIANVAADPGLSLYEKARRLYDWVINNVHYQSGTPHISPIDQAQTAFTLGRGDCYVFYAAIEVLFTRAGIPNVQMSRVGGVSHYWSLVNTGNGWYHVDATPFAGVPRVRFMFSESVAQDFTQQFPNASYNHDRSLYPQPEWE